LLVSLIWLAIVAAAEVIHPWAIIESSVSYRDLQGRDGSDHPLGIVDLDPENNADWDAHGMPEEPPMGIVSEPPPILSPPSTEPPAVDDRPWEDAGDEGEEEDTDAVTQTEAPTDLGTWESTMELTEEPKGIDWTPAPSDDWPTLPPESPVSTTPPSPNEEEEDEHDEGHDDEGEGGSDHDDDEEEENHGDDEDHGHDEDGDDEDYDHDEGHHDGDDNDEDEHEDENDHGNDHEDNSENGHGQLDHGTTTSPSPAPTPSITSQVNQQSSLSL